MIFNPVLSLSCRLGEVINDENFSHGNGNVKWHAGQHLMAISAYEAIRQRSLGCLVACSE